MVAITTMVAPAAHHSPYEVPQQLFKSQPCQTQKNSDNPYWQLMKRLDDALTANAAKSVALQEEQATIANKVAAISKQLSTMNLPRSSSIEAISTTATPRALKSPLLTPPQQPPPGPIKNKQHLHTISCIYSCIANLFYLQSPQQCHLQIP